MATTNQMVKTLVAAGVERIYGVVGDSLNGITDSLRRQENRLGAYAQRRGRCLRRRRGSAPHR